MMEINRRKTIKLITIALSLLFVGYSPALAAEPASVRMGFVPVVTAAPLALAIERRLA
jgi:ABC-type nitrate/sulfonate/bicarbonate transport system substrate-binding protein